MKLFIALSFTLLSAANGTIFSNAISKEISTTSASIALSETPRQLNNNNKNNYYDLSFLTNYDIKFNGCYTGSAYQNDMGFRDMLLAKFQLCPTDSKNCKNGGDYVVSMQDFVETYVQAKMNAQQYQCTSTYESCGYYCSGSDYYDTCVSNCFSKAGVDYSYCSTYYPAGNNNNKNNKNNDFEVWRFIECNSINGGHDNNKNNNNNNNNNNGENQQYYYVGAYCANKGTQVRLGLYSDWKCTASVPATMYETLTGYQLPFTNSSIIGSESLNCMSHNQNNNNKNNNNNNNNNGGNQALEVCQNVYQSSAKCESNMQIETKDTSSCPYVNKGVVQVSKAMAGDYNGTPSKLSAVVPTIFATLFGISTFLSCGYIYYLRHVLNKRVKAFDEGLASQVGGEAA